jgi:hypothetical protein
MDLYQIRLYTHVKASILGLQVFPSEHSRWKIEVYDGAGVFLCYCGEKIWRDYPMYLESHGMAIAHLKKQAYHKRHKNKEYGTPAWASSELLW